MKRIISAILALAIMSSALIFCYADDSVKLDARLEWDGKDTARVIFSIPENSHLNEINLNVSYDSYFMDVGYNEEICFESLLSPQDETLMEWNCVTAWNQMMNLGYTDVLHPLTIVDGYYKGGEGLLSGGDIFALEFSVYKERFYEFNTYFEFITNYVGFANDYTYSDITVPEFINYSLNDTTITSITTTYKTYDTAEELKLLSDQSKLQEDTHDTFVPNSTSPGTNSNGELKNIFGDCYTGTGSNGGFILAQAFINLSPFINGFQLYMNMDNAVTKGTPTFVVAIQKNINGNSTSFSAGSSFYYKYTNPGTHYCLKEYSYGNDVAIFDTDGSIKYIKLGWEPGNYGRATFAWYDTGTTENLPLYVSAQNTNSSFGLAGGEQKYRMYFKTLYDATVAEAYENLRAYIVNAGVTTWDVDHINNVQRGTQVLGWLSSTEISRLRNGRALDKEAMTAYDNAKAAVDAALAKCSDYVSKVNAIYADGKVTISDKAAFEAANTAYINLTTAQKNYSTVKTAKSNYDTYHTQYAGLVNGSIAVTNAINAIGSPVLWSNRSKVSDARALYNTLNDEQKANVTNYSTLTTAEARITTLTNAKNKVANAMKNVPALADQDYLSTHNTYIYNANIALQELDALGDQSLKDDTDVAKYRATLTAANNKQAELAKAIDDFVALVKKCSPVTLDSHAAINAANTAASKLTAGCRSHIEAGGYIDKINYIKLLSDYNTTYQNMVAANEVDTKIYALGTITWSKKASVEAARAAYNRLDADAKAYVKGLSTLTSAESTIATLESKRQALIAAVEALPSVSSQDYTPTHNTLVANAAKAKDAILAYNDTALTASVQSYIDRLKQAENKQSELDNEIKAFVALVDACSPVDVDKKTQINEAITAYGNLTTGQKDYLKDTSNRYGINYISRYETYVSQYNAAVKKVDNVEALIEKIFTEKNNNLLHKIDKYNAAYDAYTKLTTAQKNELNNNRTYDYDHLVKAANQIAVDKIIDEIIEMYGIDGRLLNHEKTDSMTYFNYCEKAISNYNSLYGSNAYNYEFITKANYDKIYNEIKLIYGFDDCTRTWIKDGRHLDPSDIKKDSYSADDTAPITNDSQVSVYFQVEPKFQKFGEASSTTIVDFEKNTTDITYVASTYLNTSLGDEGSNIKQGSYAKKMVMTDPLQEYTLNNGTVAYVGGQFFVTFNTAKNYTSYNGFKIWLYSPIDLSYNGGILRINFITSSNNTTDGFNFQINLDYNYGGWNLISFNKRDIYETVGSPDWSKIDRISITWFNTDRITPKDGNGTCFLMFDDLKGYVTSTTATENISATLENGLIMSLFFQDKSNKGLPKGTKIALKFIKSGNIYGYTVDTDVNAANVYNTILSLDNFKLLEAGTGLNESYKNITSINGPIDGLSFVLILDFTNATLASSYEGSIAISIYDRDEYFNYTGEQPKSTVYSMRRTTLKYDSKKNISAGTLSASAPTTIQKNGSITLSGSYSVSDSTSGYTDTLNTANTYVALNVKLKNANGSYVNIPSGAKITNASGVTVPTNNNKGVGNKCFILNGATTSTSVSSKSYSFTIDFSDCIIPLSSGTYTVEVTTTRVAKQGYNEGYFSGIANSNKVTKTTAFTIEEDSFYGLNPTISSLGGATSNIIDTSKSSIALVLSTRYTNRPNSFDPSNAGKIEISLQQKSGSSYVDLTESTYMSGTLSKSSLANGTNTYWDTTLTLNGTKFAKGGTYRLVFTFTSGNTTLVRYLNFVTTK